MRYLPIILIAFILTGTHSLNAQSKRKLKKQRVTKVLVTAREYIGTPYKYGGMSKSGVDCSGLTTLCFEQGGYSLPRTAKDQSKYGKIIPRGSVKVGDLVFFKFNQKGKRWFHSGIVSDVSAGEIKFIHASTSRGVIESSLNENYYKGNVKNFRRVIDGKK